MRRRFNFTGRKRIHHRDIAITLASVDDIDKFYAHLSLDDYDLPEDGKICIEAYDRNSFMRFDFGTVDNPQACCKTELTAFHSTDNIYFRVKVTAGDGSGRILALAKLINPSSQDDRDESRRSILRVAYDDLNGRPWKLEVLDQEHPVLVIDRSIEGGTALVRSNKFFFACVYPTVLESVLIHILLLNNYLPDSSEDESDAWMDDWIEFALSFPGAPRIDFSNVVNEEDKRDWISQVVAAFSRSNNALRKMRLALEEVGA